MGQNLNALDQAMKDEKTSTALHISSSGDLIVGTKENQTVKDMEIRGKLTSGSLSTGNITATGDVTVTGKMAADGVTDETTKDGTYIKQNNTVGNNLVSLNTQVKANADAINEEAQKRKYSVTNLEKADAAEAATREAKDNELNERITNEANAIHDEIKAGDEKLDTRITNVKEYLEKQTSDTYVSKDDAAVQDGAIVKADKTIGENVTNLDAALAKETADRLGADKAQDKVIEQVNQNMVDGFNTINKNMADGFTALNQADANELAGRMAADTKLVEAVNSGLSLSNDNVLQKNTTTIDAQGNVTTSKTDANEMILNKGKDNQITLNKNGIKVGTNSTVVDKDGVYTGGDTYSEAKAAMSADGKIKGANGAFTVDENGNVTSKATITGETVTDGKGASMSNGTVTGKTLTDGIATITNGNVNTSGSITGGTVTSTGNISALGDIHAGGAITGASASIQGALTAGSATITGDLTAGGAIQGKSISDGTATMQNGNLTGVKNLSAETITTSGNATIGGDLTVNGKLNVDEIDLTKSGIVGDNNVTASTKDGSEKESAIDYDENGTSTWAKSTDADGNWNKSTLTVEGNDVTSKVIDSEKNSNLSTQTSTQSQSTLKDKDSNTNTATQSATESSSVLQDKEGKTSTFQQRVDEILNQINSSDTVFSKVDQKVDNITSEVKNGDNATSTTQSATDITNTAKQGTITNEAQKLVNKASDTISNEAANNITNTSTNGNIANTATNGTISNNAKELTNTASENITNKAENGNISNIASNGTISNEAKTISNKADEALTNDAKTITNTASESVTTQIGDGSTVQSVMNESGIANKATGKSITNDAATITNTGTTSVTNQVGNNKVLVDTTHVQSAFGDTIYTTWDESGITNNATDKTVTTNAKDILNTATGDITNSATNGTITNTAKDLVNTASENMTNNVGKDLTTTVGGKQTTTVTGDSSLTAENINNTAKNKITNKAIDVETDASSSIVNKVSNDAGSNTSTQLSYETKEEMSQADGKTASYLRGAAEEKSQLTDVDKKTTIDTIAGQTNTNITDGTNTSNDLQKADQIASSVTDGTNTTVVNQDAKSLASSITDGTKANNTNNTVDKSEQLIKANDTQYSTTTKTATKMEDALVSGSNIIDVIKGLDAAGNPLISSAVTDGTTITGISQNAKDINLSAASGTITNDAQNITNKAAETLSNSAKNIANTTTDTLHVTSTSTFDGTATFKDIVTMEKDLSVAGSMTASSYKVGDKTYIDSNGINANDQKVVNVAPGRIAADSKDAINGSQLYQTNERVTSVENRVGTVENRVDKLDSRVDKVGANAAALANLHPLEFDADSKWNIAAAVGGYKGETATAIGAFYRPNENVMVNVSSSFGTGENMYGGGISLRIGQGGNKARRNATNGLTEREKAMQKQIDSLTSRLDALLSVINPNMSKDFPDVPENHWAYEAVSRLAGNGVIQGYEDGKYHGDRTMTRYEMAEIIYNALSKGAKAEKKLVEEFKPELQAMAAQKKAFFPPPCIFLHFSL
ncbi:YadA-like family protein [Megasphaera elsdenii]|uniref:YadA-like family protein n=1 Tax=Megasphaera elsdenii TaxID=907 RepID=UPI002E75A348|nr:S-layer homology domain-containing protein [Megasphaera elsdenii]MEE0403446.1 YadA-like family protein [Megasphaera elsdenii]